MSARAKIKYKIKFVGKALKAIYKMVLIPINTWRSHAVKINPNKIVFTNFSGNYDCNPKYICEEIIRRKLPWQLVWTVWGHGRNENVIEEGRYPAELTLTNRYSKDFYQHLYDAHIIIDNGTSFASAAYRKKTNQVLINTWHGSLGIKRFPKNTSMRNWNYNRIARWNGKMTDYMISNSAFEDGYYRETYFQHPQILRFGHARNDPLFRKGELEIQCVRDKLRLQYGIPESYRICLYAPTFRDAREQNPYNIPYAGLRDVLRNRFGGEWVILTRLHFRSKHLGIMQSMPFGVVSVTDYPDIVELMQVADVGITDYSSWICEYVHTRRPGFMYATDIEQYDCERGFYDPPDKMPFPLSTSGDELLRSILEFDEAKYVRDVAEFLQRKECVDDGHAAARIVDWLEEMMKS